jgi:sugar transferase EpsL
MIKHNKKYYDYPIALLLWFMVSPVMVLIAIFVRYMIGTPVFFKQRRPGLKGSPFEIYKFRTMSEERDNEGNLLKDEKRLNSFGKFLRRTSLDELPELINVLKGEMSIVGPRPLLMEYLSVYSRDQMKRHDIKPGITGWAQINGRNAISWERKFELDKWYVQNQSFELDIYIIIKTIIIAFKGDGINYPGHVTSKKFRPNS